MDVLKTVDEEENDVPLWTIRTLCRDRCAPELEATYVMIAQVLGDANQTAHLDELDLLYAQLDSQAIAPEEVVVSVDEILRLATERALNQVGVELSEDVPLDMLLEAATVCLLFDPTDTPSVIVDVMTSAEDEDDGFCKLMEQLGTYEADDWVPYILQINDHFCDNVQRVSQEAVQTDAVEGPDAVILKRLGRLLKVDSGSLGATLGVDNLGVGLSLESLYGLHVGRLLDLPEADQVHQLYSLAVISNESHLRVDGAVAACLDDLCLDLDARRRAEQHRVKARQAFTSIFVGDGHA